MDLFLLNFLKKFTEKKLNQTRCQDPYIWSRILDYVNKQLKEVKK